MTWEFDGKGRRIRQTTYDGSSGTYVVTEDLKFLSDGWRHIAELNATNNAVVRSYVWGLDLTGTMDGAGGVGGLLMMNSAASGIHFHAFDGNGNVTGLTKAIDGTVSAQYEYGPFAEVLRATGPMAKANPLRFSTKYQDDETDLIYYGFRNYSASMGRWMSRDPVGQGGFELYGFARNEPLGHWDKLGLLCCGSCKCQSVTVSFVPGGANFQWGLILEEPGLYKYGNVMTVRWQVTGDPRKCKFGQLESGFVVMFHSSGAGGTRHGSWSYISADTLGHFTSKPCGKVYEDWIGGDFTVGVDSGEWFGDYTALSITLECTSSDGSKAHALAMSIPAGQLNFFIPSK